MRGAFLTLNCVFVSAWVSSPDVASHRPHVVREKGGGFPIREAGAAEVGTLAHFCASEFFEDEDKAAFWRWKRKVLEGTLYVGMSQRMVLAAYREGLHGSLQHALLVMECAETNELVAMCELGLVDCPIPKARQHNPDQPFIANVVVKPMYRRRGLASDLLEECAILAEAWGYDELFLEVQASNAGARQLYEARGFVCEGRKLGWPPWQEQETQLQYRRRLNECALPSQLIAPPQQGELVPWTEWQAWAEEFSDPECVRQLCQRSLRRVGFELCIAAATTLVVASVGTGVGFVCQQLQTLLDWAT